MLKFFKALIIGYTVLWGIEEIKSRRPLREGPSKRLRPRRPQ
jgi:hypothetical protein